MRLASQARSVTLVAWSLAGVCGCQLVMNLDVSGYTAAPVDASCGDASCPLPLTCIGESDCDAGQVCCVGLLVSDASSGAAASCQAGPCGVTAVQLCRTSGECGASGPCSPCAFGGVSVGICGPASSACSP